MTRVAQPEGTKGSLKWTQRLINDHPNLINEQLSIVIGLSEGENIEWVSPLRSDDYAEYRDSSFVERLGITLEQRTLDSFWPKRGPQWDALGHTNRQKIFIVESKAHIEEIISPSTQASKSSRIVIEESIKETKAFLAVNQTIDWTGTFYQYTNRLAHLYLLRELNGINAYLVFLYFLNDTEMNGSQSIREWQAAAKVLKAAIGLKGHPFLRYVIDIFVDVSELKDQHA